MEEKFKTTDELKKYKNHLEVILRNQKLLYCHKAFSEK